MKPTKQVKPRVLSFSALASGVIIVLVSIQGSDAQLCDNTFKIQPEIISFERESIDMKFIFGIDCILTSTSGRPPEFRVGQEEYLDIFTGSLWEGRSVGENANSLCLRPEKSHSNKDGYDY